MALFLNYAALLALSMILPPGLKGIELGERSWDHKSPQAAQNPEAAASFCAKSWSLVIPFT
jgi:hypothetical protein